MTSNGYQFTPTRYHPPIGYAQLDVWISDKPSGRFFDVKYLVVPIFEDRTYHQRVVSRHGDLAPVSKVCTGLIKLTTHQDEPLHAFCFGGELHDGMDDDLRHCIITSGAPILKLKEDPTAPTSFLSDELQDILATTQARLGYDEDAFYGKIARLAPQQVFFSSLVTIQDRFNQAPAKMHNEKFHRLSASLAKVIQVIKDAEGWDGTAPHLDTLISSS